jgi:hypothetical protein
MVDQHPISIQIGQRLHIIIISISAIWTYCPGTCRAHGCVASKSKTTIGADYIVMHTEQAYGHRTAGNPTGHYQPVDKPGLREQHKHT